MTLVHDRDLRVLDFDCETMAAGFADPQWVPQKVTCIAWSWVGSDRVEVHTCGGSAGLYEEAWRRRALLGMFRTAYDEADMVTGHNLLRFDLPVLNADMIRLGLPPLGTKLVQDTMRLPRTKGLKKGQDNLAGLVETYERKLALDWQQWEDAYATPGWPVVMDRARSDVIMHKELRAALLERGLLRTPIHWRP